MQNALTFNIEKKQSTTGSEDPTSNRMIENTQRALDFLAKHDAPATFFINSKEAEANAQLVRMIDQSGHEVACQSTITDESGIDNFRSELKTAKSILEQQSSRQVQGFRSTNTNFSTDSDWAFDILIDEGFQYDASMIPPQTANIERFPHKIDRLDERSIIEVPLSTARFFGKSRILGSCKNTYQSTLTNWGYQRIHNKENQPFIHTLNIWQMEETATQNQLQKLLNQYRFTSIRNLLRNLHLLN